MTGNQNDILNRLQAVLPPWFFNGVNPILNGLLAAYAQTGSFAYTQLQYVKLQTRIATATDQNLDLISQDLYGLTFPRLTGETDQAFRTRLLANFPPLKATRAAMTQVLVNLTGRTPRLFEPRRPADTGGYSSGGIGYGVAGGWGSIQVPFTGFIDAYRPLPGNGKGGAAGYNSPAGGYSSPAYLAYGSGAQTSRITDAQIYQAIDQTKVCGTQVWVRISS